MSGIVSLAIVFATITMVALHNVGDTVLLVGLATTLPRQIEMTYELHLLATGWNDFIAIWTRFGGVAANMLPRARSRISTSASNTTAWCCAKAITPMWSRRSAMRCASRWRSRPAASMCAAATAPANPRCWRQLKTEMKKRAYYWPTTDRLAFQFAGGVVPVDVEEDDEDEPIVVAESMDKKLGFSSGERQLKSLQEIVKSTTRKSICSTNGTPISTPPTRPRPMRWSTSSPRAPASSKSRTAIRRHKRPERAESPRLAAGFRCDRSAQLSCARCDNFWAKPGPGGTYEAARIHRPCRRRGDRRAACRARTAGRASASDRRTDESSRWRSGSASAASTRS